MALMRIYENDAEEGSNEKGETGRVMKNRVAKRK